MIAVVTIDRMMTKIIYSISLETQAKLLIKEKRLDLASSFILDYENSCNPYSDRKIAVKNFLDTNVSDYVGSEKSEEVITKTK